jgi:hypothetical protein
MKYKSKKNELLKLWVPKKAVKRENTFAFYVGILNKYTKKRPKQIPIALSHVARTPGIPSYQSDTRRFLL